MGVNKPCTCKLPGLKRRNPMARKEEYKYWNTIYYLLPSQPAQSVVVPL